MRKISNPIEFFTLDDSLLDTSILSYQVNTVSSKVQVIVDISNARSKSSWNKAKLIFENVKKISFYWDHDHHFYTIDRYKWILADEIFYISLDPYPDEVEGIHEKDMDVIICEHVIAYVA